MKRLHFQVANNLSLLHDEVHMALLDCRPVPNLDGRIDPFTGAVELVLSQPNCWQDRDGEA